jgi:hypothetical protein
MEFPHPVFRDFVQTVEENLDPAIVSLKPDSGGSGRFLIRFSQSLPRSGQEPG